MTFAGLVGVFSALAVVLGLLFVALRLVRHLPALSRRAAEGPELKVLGRAGLTPKQGVATVQVGQRTLVVGYGEGGVRYLADAGRDENAPETVTTVEPLADAGGAELHLATPPVQQLRLGLDVDEAPSMPGGLEPTGARTPVFPAEGTRQAIPFRQALGRALRQASLFGLTLAALFHGAAAPMHAAPLATALAPLPQEAVETPQVDGPQSPVSPTVPRPDFPAVDVTMGEGDDALRLSGPVGTVLFIGFLTLLPTLLLLMTSFTRILVVLHLLKQAIGTQTAPPAHLLSAMALLLTGFVMAPTLSEANETAVRPWMDGQIDEVQMLDSASVPFREFMLSQVRDTDLETFVEMRDAPAPETVDEIPLVVVSSAFVVSELRSAFQMGFALFLPFVVIDIVVASVLMSMGMFMLPPVMVSLPFKLLLFVMVDGWSLIVGSLVRSFA